jgi:hypothetical protein
MDESEGVKIKMKDGGGPVKNGAAHTYLPYASKLARKVPWIYVLSTDENTDR